MFSEVDEVDKYVGISLAGYHVLEEPHMCVIYRWLAHGTLWLEVQVR